MNITVIGAGAMGSLYGGFLAIGPDNYVTLINTRAEHIEAINQRGLIIHTPDKELLVKNLTALTSPKGLDTQDLILVFVKATATETAARQAAPLVGPKTIVLTLQNGLGNLEKLCQVLPPSQVVGGSSAVGSNLKGPGEVILRGLGQTIFGELDGRASERLQDLKSTFEAAGLPVSLTTNLSGVLWTKLIINVGVNALAALLGLKNGQLLRYPEAETLVEGAVQEAWAVAKAMDIQLETDDPVAYTKKVIQNTSENVCSMLQDVRAKRKTEIAVINGAIVEYGAKYGLKTPLNLVLTNMVKVLERNYSP